MSQDYHIYLHGVGGGSGGDKTKSFDNRGKDFQSKMSGFFGNGENKEEEMAEAEGISALAKSVPVLAIIAAAYKISEKVLTASAGFLETYTGNHQFSMGVNNFFTATGNVLNPIGWAKKEITFQLENQKHNKRVEQTRQLIGHSVLTRIKEGV